MLSMHECQDDTRPDLKYLPVRAVQYINNLEARITALEKQVAELTLDVKNKDKQIADLENKNRLLTFQNAKLVQEKYGSSSEGIINICGAPYGDDNGDGDSSTANGIDEYNKDMQDIAESSHLSPEELKDILHLTGDNKRNNKDKPKKNANNKRKKFLKNYLE